MMLGPSCALLSCSLSPAHGPLPFIWHIYFTLCMHMIQSRACLTALLPSCHMCADLCYTLNWLNLQAMFSKTKAKDHVHPTHVDPHDTKYCLIQFVWTNEEDRLLRVLCNQFGQNWQLIALVPHHYSDGCLCGVGLFKVALPLPMTRVTGCRHFCNTSFSSHVLMSSYVLESPTIKC
jgi:hypothetical protein